MNLLILFVSGYVSTVYLSSPKTPLEIPVYSFIAVLIGIFSVEGSRSRVFLFSHFRNALHP